MPHLEIVEPPELAPFDPPYELGGASAVIVGRLAARSGAAPDPAALAPPGFRPLMLGRRPLAVIVVNTYDAPPAELPIRYREVIAAIVVRRGLTLCSMPFDMVLDAPVPTELGRLHYGLPKRLDTSLRVSLERSRLSIESARAALAIEAVAFDALPSACSLPLRVATTLGVRIVTSAVDVLGAAYPPPRRARIALAPSGCGRAFRVVRAELEGFVVESAWCQAWRWAVTTLGAPHELEVKVG